MTDVSPLKVNRVKLKMLIWSIPSYRAAIYRRLSQNRNLDFEVCAGANTRTIDGAKVPSAVDVGCNTGIKWRRLEARRLRWFRNYEWQPEAVKMAWRDDIDAIIVQGNKSLSNWLVLLLCKLRGIPVIDWSMGVRGPESRLKWSIRRLLLRWPDAHLLYGSFARDFYVQHGFREDRVSVIHNSLDYERQAAIRKALTTEQIRKVRQRFGAAGSDDRLVFHSGRIERRKNLSLLLSAIRTLKDRGHHIVLVLIGSGNEEAALQQQVQEKDLAQNVVFYGACYEEEILGPIISASDLAVVPGATGLVAMHSLVYGTPLLTRDNSAWLHGPEIETIIEGQTGGYFRDGDLDDLISKMEAMLYPRPCKEQMGEACMKIIDEQYTPYYQECVIIQLVNKLLPESKRIPLPDPDHDAVQRMP